MKTVRMYEWICTSRYLFIACMLVAISTWWGCSEPPPIKPGPAIELSSAEQYIGHYQLVGEKKTISINHFKTLVSDDEVTHEPGWHQVYVSNLVKGPQSTVVADWNGVSFIIDTQTIMVDLVPTNISGRVSLHEDELTVFYHLASHQSETSHSEQYVRLF